METDNYGNVKCHGCNKFYSPSFPECPYCCSHEELDLVENWYGADDGGGWGLDVVCSRCGKNFGFSREMLISEYKVVKKSNAGNHGPA